MNSCRAVAAATGCRFKSCHPDLNLDLKDGLRGGAIPGQCSSLCFTVIFCEASGLDDAT